MVQTGPDIEPAGSLALNRRPLRTRSKSWVPGVTHGLVRAGVTPNAISMLGICFAAAAATAMLYAPTAGAVWWLTAAAGIQLRLAANMFDGLVAIEGGRHTATGALFNEIPDRIEDSLLLVAAGYATGNPTLGWVAALLACATAYVRVLGGSLGHPQDFCGPQAKQHRMAVLTLATLACAVLPAVPVMHLALAAISAGTLLTLVRRILRLADRMRSVQS